MLIELRVPKLRVLYGINVANLSQRKYIWIWQHTLEWILITKLWNWWSQRLILLAKHNNHVIKIRICHFCLWKHMSDQWECVVDVPCALDRFWCLNHLVSAQINGEKSGRCCLHLVFIIFCIVHSVACKECVATQAYQPSLLQSESHSIAPQKITPCVRQARLTRCFTFLTHSFPLISALLPPNNPESSIKWWGNGHCSCVDETDTRW